MKLCSIIYRKLFQNSQKFVPNSFIDDISHMYFKMKGLHDEKNEIKTIVLGNSQARYLVNPEYIRKYTFNAGFSSMDLYSVFHFYKNMPIYKNLESVYLVHSMNGEFYDLSKSSMRFRCFLYERLLNVPNPNKNPVLEDLSGVDYFLKHPYSTTKFFRGYDYPAKFIPVHSSLEKRIDMQLATHIGDQWEYLEAIASLCRERNHRLTLILAPNRTDYITIFLEKTRHSKQAEIFERITTFAGKKAIPVVDAANVSHLSNEDFGDFSHVNYNGARKFSLALDQIQG